MTTKMSRVDGHAHSSASDGSDRPAQLVRLAQHAGLVGVTISDHDTFAGWDEATQAAHETGMGLLRGVELSMSYRGSSAHLLAYLPDRNDPGLKGIMEQIREGRRTRTRRLVENISVDFPQVTWEKLRAKHLDDSIPIGRPHMADLLVEEKIVPNRSAAFDHILHPEGPYYVHHWAPAPAEMVELVVAAGGVPVLAHGQSQMRQRPLPVDVLKDMVDAGLFGLERDHREHDEAARSRVDSLAQQFGLRMTGGSDYHGTGKQNLLGENTLTQQVLDEIIERGSAEAINFPER